MTDNGDAQTADTRVAVVIEDDPDIRALIITVFRQSGFTVHGASEGENGVEAVKRHAPAVVTVDLGLPGIDGFEVARQIRLVSDCYIIMLSARTDEAETLMGLNAGADDFITKPFRPRELRARIAAMLRRPRTPGPAPPPDPAPVAETVVEAVLHEPQVSAESPAVAVDEPVAFGGSDTLEHNGLRVDPQTRSVWVNQQALDLTRTEFDLLLTLMRTGRRVRTKADLVRHLRSDHFSAAAYVSGSDERAIEVHIGNLRRKLGQNGQSSACIETVRGVGYRMAAKPPHPV